MKKSLIALAGVSILAGCSSEPTANQFLGCEPMESLPVAKAYIHELEVQYKDRTVWSSMIVSEMGEMARVSSTTTQDYVESVTNGEPDIASVESGLKLGIGVVQNDKGEMVTQYVIDHSELVSLQKIGDVESPETRLNTSVGTFTGTEVALSSIFKDLENVTARIKTCPIVDEVEEKPRRTFG